jgi:antitoxin YobK
MESDRYDELIRLIESNRKVRFTGIQGRGVSDEWIQKAERELGLQLPPSYKWWLKKYGGGSIERAEIYSIYEMGFEDAVPGDIVYVAITNRENGLFDKEKLFICEPGTDEAWYFDTSQKDDAGEYPVYLYDYTDGSSFLYAENFVEFLLTKIQEL